MSSKLKELENNIKRIANFTNDLEQQIRQMDEVFMDVLERIDVIEEDLGQVLAKHENKTKTTKKKKCYKIITCGVYFSTHYSKEDLRRQLEDLLFDKLIEPLEISIYDENKNKLDWDVGLTLTISST